MSPRSLSPTRRSAHCDDTCIHLTLHAIWGGSVHVASVLSRSLRSCTALQENVIAEVLRPHVSGTLSGCLDQFSTIFTCLFVISVHLLAALVLQASQCG